MAEPKRHHYLPEKYLRGFTSAGEPKSPFAVYDREDDEFRVQTPRNTAVITHYYTVETESGAKSTGIEQLLQRVEDLAMPALKKLDEAGHLDVEARQTLALFVALLHTRVPQFERGTLEMANGVYKKTTRLALPTRESVAKKLRALYPDDPPNEATTEEIFRIFQTGDYNIRFDKGWLRRTMLEMALSVGSGLWQMDWLVYHAPESSSFFTSDSPFTVLPPRKFKPVFPYTYGIGTRGATKYLPLTCRTCLCIADTGVSLRHELATKRHVQEINIQIARRCERNVIARDMEPLKSVIAKARLSGTKRGPIVHLSVSVYRSPGAMG